MLRAARVRSRLGYRNKTEIDSLCIDFSFVSLCIKKHRFAKRVTETLMIFYAMASERFSAHFCCQCNCTLTIKDRQPCERYGRVSPVRISVRRRFPRHFALAWAVLVPYPTVLSPVPTSCHTVLVWCSRTARASATSRFRSRSKI